MSRKERRAEARERAKTYTRAARQQQEARWAAQAEAERAQQQRRADEALDAWAGRRSQTQQRWSIRRTDPVPASQTTTDTAESYCTHGGPENPTKREPEHQRKRRGVVRLGVASTYEAMLLLSLSGSTHF